MQPLVEHLTENHGMETPVPVAQVYEEMTGDPLENADHLPDGVSPDTRQEKIVLLIAEVVDVFGPYLSDDSKQWAGASSCVQALSHLQKTWEVDVPSLLEDYLEANPDRSSDYDPFGEAAAKGQTFKEMARSYNASPSEDQGQMEDLPPLVVAAQLVATATAAYTDDIHGGHYKNIAGRYLLNALAILSTLGNHEICLYVDERPVKFGQNNSDVETIEVTGKEVLLRYKGS